LKTTYYFLICLVFKAFGLSSPPFRKGSSRPIGNKGAIREEFFVNHVKRIFETCYLKGKRGEKTPDFLVENTVIEVGGESKKRYQNPDYIAVDGLTPERSKIPLFLFGFIY